MNPTIWLIGTLFIILFFTGSTAFTFGQGPEADISRCWSYSNSDLKDSVLAADKGHIYIGSSDGRVEAVSGDGKKIWQSEFGGEISSELLPVDRGLMVVTSTVSTDPKPGVSTLRSLSKETGIMNWGVNLPAAARFYLNSFNGSLIVISEEGAILSVDLSTGQLRWERQVKAKVLIQPVLSLTKLIVATDAKKLLTISLNTGMVEFERLTRFRPTAMGETSERELIVGDERGNVTSFARTGVDWQFRSGGQISAIFAIGSNILAASHDNFVYLVAGSNGSIVWKKRVSGRLVETGKIGERYILMSGVDDHNAVLINVADGKVAGQLSFNDDERITYEPIMYGGRLFVLTNRTLYAYSLTGCSQDAQKAANLRASGL